MTMSGMKKNMIQSKQLLYTNHQILLQFKLNSPALQILAQYKIYPLGHPIRP